MSVPVADVRAKIARKERLADTLGAWVLLGRPVSESGGGAWSFRTQSVEIDVVKTAGGTQLVVRDDDMVIPVKKKPGAAAFGSTILLGRSDSNDVVIPHASVSKLHARIDVNAAGIAISDASSSNGSKVNDAALDANTKLAVQSGAIVVFGKCSFCLLSTEELQRLLSQKKT